MKNPFTIEMAENKSMKAWDIQLSVGGFPTKEEAEKAAKVIAEFMSDGGGWTERIQ